MAAPGRDLPAAGNVSSARAVGEVAASRVVLDIPRRRPDGTTLWPSDHYGILAELVPGTGGEPR
jgi:hypothetical protein